MQKAVSPLSIQITAATYRTVHMYLRNVFVHYSQKIYVRAGPSHSYRTGPDRV